MFEKNETRQKVKKLKNDVKELRKQYKKLEFRPCQNDAELIAKESELKSIMDKIYSLENEQDRLILDSVRKSL
ncbi:MAG: hypothetical protein PVG39_17880 [Desulfobacteraceae bacterium]|jgi:chromosome segregation ATPase